jgi:hypothetical protein
MRTTRSLLAAAAAAVAILAATTGVADAGEAVSTDIAFECDTDTGNFVVTLTLDNLTQLEGDIEADYGVFEGDTETDSGEFTMTPNPVPGGDSSVGVLEVPGTTTFVGVDIFVDFGEGSFEGSAGVEIGETCEATTTTTTAESTTTTAAAAAEAVRPTFTG